MSNPSKFIAKAEQLQAFLEYDAGELGKATGFIQRKSKMNATCFAKKCIYCIRERNF